MLFTTPRHSTLPREWSSWHGGVRKGDRHAPSEAVVVNLSGTPRSHREWEECKAQVLPHSTELWGGGQSQPPEWVHCADSIVSTALKPGGDPQRPSTNIRSAELSPLTTSQSLPPSLMVNETWSPNSRSTGGNTLTTQQPIPSRGPKVDGEGVSPRTLRSHWAVWLGYFSSLRRSLFFCRIGA